MIVLITNPAYGVWTNLYDARKVDRQPFRNEEEDCIVAALDIKRNLERFGHDRPDN